ncbi:Oidioi.mRNA.OKI2018_I69.XSR.g13782.t1.cds [Oikopleura dioica]|uniref:Dehydrogenase/reductase SDR family member 6 n=1 Tax=Oikopleura dioica TaxID=34765 RepID=A0ABN7SE15_OIKDI|nr:Oidioi.mRNA.OKI2018_I69.XSR.g13782.t1.cds [Oikopleura dioica]
MSLSGKVCVVTAAGQGIGRASAEAFFNAGGKVFASDINEELLKTLPEGIESAKLDVTDSAAVSAYFSNFEKIDVLFNVAGWVPHGTILDSDDDVFDKAMDLNVKSMFRTSRAVIPIMLKNGGGSIINMSSVASSRKGVPLRCVYNTTKAAVIGLTKSIAADFIKEGIRCNAIMPGTVDTPSLQERIASTKGMTKEEALDMFMKRQPTGTLMGAGDVAQLAVYLASDHAKLVTGGEHVIDGGWSL